MSKSNVLAELPDQLASPSALNKFIAILSQCNLKKACHVRKLSTF